MTNSFNAYCRAKRLCALAARGLAIASRRIRAGKPADITMKRVYRLQLLARAEWKGVSR